MDPDGRIYLTSKSSGTIPFSNCGGNAPLARHHVVARQIPPEVIMQGFGVNNSISQRPRPPKVSQSMMKIPGGPSVPSLPAPTESADVNAFRPAVHCMGPRVAGLSEDLLRFDDFVNPRLGGVGFGIHDINSERTNTGDDVGSRVPKKCAL